MSRKGECWQEKHTQHAPSTKTECDYLNGWIKKRSQMQKSHPRDLAGEHRRKRKKHWEQTGKKWPWPGAHPNLRPMYVLRSVSSQGCEVHVPEERLIPAVAELKRSLILFLLNWVRLVQLDLWNEWSSLIRCSRPAGLKMLICLFVLHFCNLCILTAPLSFWPFDLLKL